MDFIHCYRILGLSPECDWQQARHCYQQLVSRHHPDRPAASADGQSLTEINRAWRQLRKYYQQHGHMPLQTNDARPASRPVTPFAPAFTPLKSRHWNRLFTIAALAFVLLLFLPEHTASPPPPEPQPVATITTDANTTGTPAIGILIRHGDPLGHIIETLGPPQDTRGSRWYYGDSWIELRDGRVSDWHSSVDHPLPTETLSHHR